MSTSLPTTLTLAEALALPAGKELDALVAEHVMGWLDIWFCPHTPHCFHGRKSAHHNDTNYQVPKYSSDIAAAWEVVEHLRRQLSGFVLCDSCGGEPWTAGFVDGPDGSEAETVSLAICRAALNACWGN